MCNRTRIFLLPYAIAIIDYNIFKHRRITRYNFFIYTVADYFQSVKGFFNSIYIRFTLAFNSFKNASRLNVGQSGKH